MQDTSRENKPCGPAHELQNKSTNRLIAALPPSCAERLLAASTYIDLPLRTLLFVREEPPKFVYFLTAGMASIVFTSEEGTTIELATLGSEGLVGWSFLLGPMLTLADCNVQVAGAAYRIPLAAMQREFDSSPDIRRRVLEYSQQQVVFANQIAACNRLHRAEARFARWLLMVSDRVGSDDIMMTQEFLSNMLGTRRTTVAEVCAGLGRIGAIEGRRGGLRILDRDLLKTRACECYGVLAERYEALYRDSPRPLGKNGFSA